MSLELDQTANDPNAASRPTALTPGSQLGKYKLERILGEGGMGVVWAARDPDLQRAVAIKLIKVAQAAPQLRQRLLREAVAMAKLKHPNVLTVYEVGTDGDRDYIAMELVDGMSLDAWLALAHPPDVVWSSILAAGRGLAAAHDAGVVHRDFKPHNVLRSRDGRVLVTDFGLARGLLDAGSDDDGTSSPGASDSVLDAQLTQTGALIGTPAYMAPEQYAGAAPDPRTDQFAYCVTVWQALTGERPFKGATLDEMKKAVGAGVAHLPAKMPRAIRGVLARGLDPDPAARWPSLDALLDALDEAAKQPVRRRRVIAVIGTLALAALALTLTLIALRKPSVVANACDAPDAAFDEAWSPTVRSQLARSVGNAPGLERVTAVFDEFRDSWVASYQKACRVRTSRAFPARVACLEGMRDQVSATVEMMRSAPPGAFERFDSRGILPPLAACERANPPLPAQLPRDPPRRSQILAVMGKLFSLVGARSEELPTLSSSLEGEARRLGWPPAVAYVIVMTADSYARRGEHVLARDYYSRALRAAREAQDHRVEARAHLGLLEATMHELAQPGATPPRNLDDPRTAPSLHPELSTALILARDAVNDDALLRGALEIDAADIYVQLAQWNRYRSAYADALAHAQEARRAFESLGDVNRVASASAVEAEIYLARGDERALDDALFAARRSADQLEAAGQPRSPALDDILRRVAFARPSWNEVHRLADRQATTLHPRAATVHGRVSPPGRAAVVAWRGALVGDPRRAYTAMPGDDVDVTTAAEDGTFTINAEPGWAIVAEQADARSVPQVIGPTTVELTLRPTQTQSGTVHGKNLASVAAFARYRVGESTWEVRVPVQADARVDLSGLPAGTTPSFGLTGDVGHGAREVTGPDIASLTWPFGQALDIVVRASPTSDGGRVWVMSGPPAPAATRQQLDVRIGTVREIAVADVRPIGASATDAGREVYRPGDRHAVFTGTPTGPITVCAVARREPTAPATCQSFDVRPTVNIEYPDGRFAGGTTPVVLTF